MCYVIGGEEAEAMPVAEMSVSTLTPQVPEEDTKVLDTWDKILSIPTIRPEPVSEKLTNHILSPSIVQSMQEYIADLNKVNKIINKWNSLYSVGTKAKLHSGDAVMKVCGTEVDIATISDGLPAITCSEAFVYTVPISEGVNGSRRTAIDIFPAIMVRTTLKTGKAEDAILVPLYRVRPERNNL